MNGKGGEHGSGNMKDSIKTIRAKFIHSSSKNFQASPGEAHSSHRAEDLPGHLQMFTTIMIRP